jgi:FAD/FMN-containing dehydrogenase
LNDGGLVIDLSRYSGVTLKSGGHRVAIRAGTPLGTMYAELAKSQQTLPAGTCPTVGITGLTTGGGYGMLVRRYGLMCDRLRRVTMVDAEGRVRDSATSSEGDDILWACKGGGGGSFGVVTDLEFDAIPSPTTVTYFSMRWAWDETTAATVIQHWMSWGAGAPRDLTSIMTLQGGWAKSIHVFGLFLAGEEALAPLIDPLRQGTKTKELVIRTLPFADALGLLAGPLPNRQSWKKKSSFGARPMSSDGIAAVIKHIETAPSSVACILEFDTMGGAVRDVAPHATAFAHRDMSYLLQYQTEWKGPTHTDVALAWIRSAFAAIDPHTSMKSYRNYSDLDLQDWQRRYFDGNYPRLQAIKSRLDPSDLFRHPQSIERARA